MVFGAKSAPPASRNELPRVLQHPGAMVPRLASDSKIPAIKELIDCLCAQDVIEDGLDFLQAVLERESLQSTVIGKGRIALPHARGRTVRRLGLALGCAAEPIEFPSGDDRHQVEVICLIAVPADTPGLYLKLLGHLARVFDDDGFHEELRDAATPEAMRELLTERMEITSSIPHHRYRS